MVVYQTISAETNRAIIAAALLSDERAERHTTERLRDRRLKAVSAQKGIVRSGSCGVVYALGLMMSRANGTARSVQSEAVLDWGVAANAQASAHLTFYFQKYASW